MSMYHEEWPLLVLTPSSARYHWEAEFQQWLGPDSTKRTNQTHIEQDDEESEEEERIFPEEYKIPMKPLNDWEIHVMTTGKEDVLPHKDTRVVICSYGLAPTLVESKKIRPGMFKCTIVDER
jgi:SNF2 family DNA or RNA helicase